MGNNSHIFFEYLYMLCYTKIVINMKNRSVFNLFVYILFIVVMIGTMYFSFALFIKYEPSHSISIEKNETNGEIETYTAIFEKNGADSIGTSSLTCEAVNGKCEIILPSIFKENGVVLGWNIENSEFANYKVGEKVILTSNKLFYAITYYENTLTIIDDSLDYLESNKLSCRVYNKHQSCSLTIPNYNKIGYETRGYSTRSDSLTGIIFPNQIYSLKKDTVLYPVYNTLTRGEVINVSKTVNKYGFIIEIEKGCNSNVYEGYLNYIDKINSMAKYLLIGSKITFLSSNTFDKLWTSKYVGMNYGPNSLRLFDVKCPNSLSSEYYPTFVHELAHTWDFYYKNYFKKNISDENDFVNLYSKYQNSNNRPFRDYSYSNIREFFADSVRYYYFKYIDPITYYRNLNYPSDIKKTLEKYICIANNNYSNIGC